MKRLEGKVAVVTGSNRGIGRGIAIELAREGCKIVVNSHKKIRNVMKSLTRSKTSAQKLFRALRMYQRKEMSGI